MRKIFLFAFTAATLSAHKGPSKQEQILEQLGQVRKQQAEILAILKEADTPPAPPAPVKVNIDGAPALGLDSAPVTIVEFTDYQCPFCNQFHTKVFPELHDKFIATGKARYVRRDLPLPMHKNAMAAAQAGRCVGEQGHFWEMTDWMQSNPDRLEELQLFQHAMDLELDIEQYRRCMATEKYRAAIEADSQEAQKLNVQGTPSFIIGKTGAVIEGNVIRGAPPLAEFEKAILGASAVE